MMRHAPDLALAAIVVFTALVRLTLDTHLDYHAEPERELAHALGFLETGDPLSLGPNVGFVANLSFDAGPWYSALLAPFLAFTPGPMAIVWLHTLTALLGVVALYHLGSRYLPRGVALLAAVAWIASTDFLRAWEEYQWHCYAVPGMVLGQLWLADRLVRRPTGITLFALLAGTSITVQVYAATAATVPAWLGLVFWLLWRRQVRWDGALAAALGAALVSAPFVLRGWIAPLFSLTADVAVDGMAPGPEWPLTMLAWLWSALQPNWTWLSPWFPTAAFVFIGIGVFAWHTIRTRDPFRLAVLSALLFALLAGAWAWSTRGRPRYLILLPPLMMATGTLGWAHLAPRLERWLTERRTAMFSGALALIIWLPAAAGWRDSTLLPYPETDGRRGANLMLGLGEQRDTVITLQNTFGWSWSQLCTQTHGKFCDVKHGIGTFSWLNPPSGNTPPGNTHVLVTVDGSAANIPDSRAIMRQQLPGAFGRNIHLVEFVPPVDYSTAIVERVHSNGAVHRCANHLPYLPTILHVMPEKRDPHTSLLGVPHLRPEAPCDRVDGAWFRITVPLLQADGSALLMLDTDLGTGAELLELARLTAISATADGTPVRTEQRLEVLGNPADGEVRYVQLEWTAGTLAFELTFPASDPLTTVDVF